MANVESDEMKSAEDWKTVGNKYYGTKKFQLALNAYKKGLLLDPNNTPIMGNLAAVYLNLRYFHRALEICERLLELDPKNVKGIYRKAKSLAGLKMYQDAIKLVEQNMFSIEKDCQKDYEDLLAKLKLLENQRITGEFDVFKLYMSMKKIQDEITDFIGPVRITEITGKGRGRGLVATENIKAGQWVIISKAFEIVFPEYDTAFDNSGGDYLAAAITEKLTAEPELRKEFYQLYAGPKMTSTPPDDSVVDVKRIEAICDFASFNGTVNSLLESGRQGDSYTDNEGVFREKSFYGTSKGIWVFPSYINHSCWDGNCFYTTYGDVMLIRSYKDIAVGEELLISYIAGVEPYWKRHTSILLHYNFRCNCTICLIDQSESPQVHMKREMILAEITTCTDNLTRLEKLFRELEKLRPSRPDLNLCAIMPLQFLMTCYYDKKEFVKSAEISTKIHDLMIKGPQIREAAPISANIAANYIEAGDIEKGRHWAELYKKEMMLGYGTMKVNEELAGPTLSLLREIGIQFD